MKKIESLFVDYIFYLNKLRNTVVRLSQTINDFVNLGGYELVYKNQWLYIYINNNQKQDIMEERISFIIATNKITFLGVNLTRNVEKLHEEKFKDSWKL